MQESLLQLPGMDEGLQHKTESEIDDGVDEEREEREHSDDDGDDVDKRWSDSEPSSSSSSSPSDSDYGVETERKLEKK